MMLYQFLSMQLQLARGCKDNNSNNNKGVTAKGVIFVTCESTHEADESFFEKHDVIKRIDTPTRLQIQDSYAPHWSEITVF